MTFSESYQLTPLEAVRRTFSPAAPIQRRDLFAGRKEQLAWVGDALEEPGRHAVIFGERGVGKTSLATICAETAEVAGRQKAVRVNCQSDDDFSSIWRKVFRKIAVYTQVPAVGFSKGMRRVIGSAVHYLAGVKQVTPDIICNYMTLLTENSPLVFFLDEFDRVSHPRAHRSIADTMKTISDEAIPVTIVLVGVADNVNDLVKEHASIERAIVQVHMPRMSQSELAAIVTNGLASVHMEVEQSAIEQITMLSQGLPSYTHLLAQHAAEEAIWRSSPIVSLEDVQAAIETSIHRAEESIRELYYQATYSTRKNMHKQVLLACASAAADEKGFFTASAVRAALSTMNKRYEISQFARYLSALCEEDRGPVLTKVRRHQQIQYRFANPLVQPYITMRGLRDGMIDSNALKACGQRIGVDANVRSNLATTNDRRPRCRLMGERAG
jgi:Cdc6-like AAA superfamily ATPase